MKDNPNHIGSTCPSIVQWYGQEIKERTDELIELEKKIKVRTSDYIKHMYRNTKKAYNLTKREALANRVQLVADFKKDYKDLQNEYLVLQSLISRKYFLEDTIARLKHDRSVDYEQLRDKDN